MSGKETQHSRSDQRDSILIEFDKRVFLTRRGCGHTRRKCNGLKDVLLDALRRRRGSCCTQWKVDDIENRND